jgi:hypothetical protein
MCESPYSICQSINRQDVGKITLKVNGLYVTTQHIMRSTALPEARGKVTLLHIKGETIEIAKAGKEI